MDTSMLLVKLPKSTLLKLKIQKEYAFSAVKFLTEMFIILTIEY